MQNNNKLYFQFSKSPRTHTHTYIMFQNGEKFIWNIIIFERANFAIRLFCLCWYINFYFFSAMISNWRSASHDKVTFFHVKCSVSIFKWFHLQCLFPVFCVIDSSVFLPMQMLSIHCIKKVKVIIARTQSSFYSLNRFGKVLCRGVCTCNRWFCFFWAFVWLFHHRYCD